MIRRRVGRAGVLGGTFDPIHTGHLAMARAAARACALERIYFVPAPAPWHRQEAPVAGYADRYAMLAVALQRRVQWLPLDVPDRAHRPTYTIDQLSWMSKHGYGERLHFIVGADSFATLPSWHRWRELLVRCDWIVLGRGASRQLPEVVPVGMIRERRAEGLLLRNGTRIHWLARFRQPASASAVRLAMRRDDAAPVPAAVAQYARRAGLYQKTS